VFDNMFWVVSMCLLKFSGSFTMLIGCSGCLLGHCYVLDKVFWVVARALLCTF